MDERSRHTLALLAVSKVKRAQKKKKEKSCISHPEKILCTFVSITSPFDPMISENPPLIFLGCSDNEKTARFGYISKLFIILYLSNIFENYRVPRRL
jgi:hypothetical protein